MSAAQALASRQFLEAMGPMINDKQKVDQVIGFIAYLGLMPEQTPLITQGELDNQYPTPLYDDVMRTGIAI